MGFQKCSNKHPIAIHYKTWCCTSLSQVKGLSSVLHKPLQIQRYSASSDALAHQPARVGILPSPSLPACNYEATFGLQSAPVWHEITRADCLLYADTMDEAFIRPQDPSLIYQKLGPGSELSL